MDNELEHKFFVVWDERYPELEQIALEASEQLDVVWQRANGDPLHSAREALEQASTLLVIVRKDLPLDFEVLIGMAWSMGCESTELKIGKAEVHPHSSAIFHIASAIDARYAPKRPKRRGGGRRVFLGHGPDLVEERARRRKLGWDTVDRLPKVPDDILERAHSTTEFVWVRTDRDTPQYLQLAGAIIGLEAPVEVYRADSAPELPMVAHVERPWDPAQTLARPSEDSIDELRLERLEIRNLRGLEALEIDFRQSELLPGHWTCIAGINGAGKSTILQAIALTLLGERLGHDLQSDRLEGFRRRDQDGNIHRTELLLQIKLGARSETLGLRIDDEGLRTTIEGKTPPRRMQDIWHRREFGHVLVSYGASRNLSSYRDNRYDSQAEEVRRQMSLFDPHAQLLHASVFLERSEHGSALRELLSALLPQVLEGTGLRVSTELKFILGDETEVEAVDLPDGFRSMVAWLGDLCTAWVSKGGSPDPERLCAVVLLDEIDLHLHPSLQRGLIPNLRRALPRVQWVVTTHSPLIISSFDRAEIRALDNTVPEGIQRLDRQILGFSTDQVYEWLMGVNPRSAQLDHELERAEAHPSRVDRDELARIVRQTPQISAEQAEALQLRTQRILAELDEKQK